MILGNSNRRGSCHLNHLKKRLFQKTPLPLSARKKQFRLFMKRIISILFLFIMTANVAVSLVEQLRHKVLTELKEVEKKDANEKEKKETEQDEKEKERKFESLVHHFSIKNDALYLTNLLKSQIFHSDFLISEYHGQLPELPPKA